MDLPLFIPRKNFLETNSIADNAESEVLLHVSHSYLHCRKFTFSFEAIIDTLQLLLKYRFKKIESRRGLPFSTMPMLISLSSGDGSWETLNLQTHRQVPQMAYVCCYASETANTLTAIVDPHWKRLSTMHSAYTVPLEPPYMNYMGKYLTINRQMANVSTLTLLILCTVLPEPWHGKEIKDGQDSWVPTGTEDTTSYAWPSPWYPKKEMRFVYRDTQALGINHCCFPAELQLMILLQTSNCYHGTCLFLPELALNTLTLSRVTVIMTKNTEFKMCPEFLGTRAQK